MDKHVSFSITKAGKDYISERGYDPVYGARPLKRTIQRLVQDPIAMRLLKGEIRKSDHLKVDRGNNGAMKIAISKN
jgi:ATP-dependent Clp protease ATP-binding subunit ClpB